jgi:hypothetical protein
MRASPAGLKSRSIRLPEPASLREALRAGLKICERSRLDGSHEAPVEAGTSRSTDFQTGTEREHAGSQQVVKHCCRKRQSQFLRRRMTRDKQFGETVNPRQCRQEETDQDRQLKKSSPPNRVVTEQEQGDRKG